MRIDPAGREYATWTITATTSPTSVDLSVDAGTTWTPLAQVGTTAQWHTLVAGPSATSNPAGTVVLPTGRTQTKVRVNGAPELVIRDTDPIDVLP